MYEQVEKPHKTVQFHEPHTLLFQRGTTNALTAQMRVSQALLERQNVDALYHM